MWRKDLLNLPNLPIAQIIQGQDTNPVWTNWFGSVLGFLRLAPTISQGIVAPTSTPSKVGNMYIDTVLGKVYVSTGVTNSADWKILN